MKEDIILFCLFVVLVISDLVLRAWFAFWLPQFLFIASRYLFQIVYGYQGDALNDICQRENKFYLPIRIQIVWGCSSYWTQSSNPWVNYIPIQQTIVNTTANRWPAIFREIIYKNEKKRKSLWDSKRSCTGFEARPYNITLGALKSH